MILCCFQIINAPKKNQEDNLSEDEKAEKSVSFVCVCLFVFCLVFPVAFKTMIFGDPSLISIPLR